MENNNRNLWISVGVVLAIFVGLVLWSMTGKSAVPSNNVNNNTPLEPVDSTEDTSAGSVNTGSSQASISYANALVKYKDARIQFDGVCQASPNNMTFKNGTSIMVDNRAPVDRAVKVGSIFNIKAYGFKIIKLSSTTLPATLLVDCDKSQNVATILLQK